MFKVGDKVRITKTKLFDGYFDLADDHHGLLCTISQVDDGDEGIKSDTPYLLRRDDGKLFRYRRHDYDWQSFDELWFGPDAIEAVSMFKIGDKVRIMRTEVVDGDLDLHPRHMNGVCTVVQIDGYLDQRYLIEPDDWDCFQYRGDHLPDGHYNSSPTFWVLAEVLSVILSELAPEPEPATAVADRYHGNRNFGVF